MGRKRAEKSKVATPEEQAMNRRSGKGGIIPPAEHQFRPGLSGNPGGRPPGQSLTARVRELFEKGEINGKPIKDGKQVADLAAEAILEKVLKGDSKIIDQVWNRLEGKVPDRIAGHDGGAVKVVKRVEFVEVIVADDDGGSDGDGAGDGERNGHGELAGRPGSISDS